MEKLEKDGWEEGETKTTQSIHNPHALASLQKGLQQVYRARGRSREEADALFGKLAINLRLLDYLYQQASKVLAGDRTAGVKFHRAIQSLTERYPDFRGSTQVLLDRVGIPYPTQGALATQKHFSPTFETRFQSRQLMGPTRTMPPGMRGLPCTTIRYSGMATIYMALWEVHILRPHDLTQRPAQELSEALDTIVGLSLGHGHLEVLSGSLMHGGLEELNRVIEREETLGNPSFRPEGGARWSHLPFPDPGSPRGIPIPEPGVGTGIGDAPIPGRIYPPAPDECEIVREACEGLLIEAINEGLPPLPLPPRRSSWAHNIDRIDFNGRCAGDTMVILGRDFGSPQPSTVHLIMKVNGECAVVPVNSGEWSDTQITVTLPDGVMPGAVGFYDSAEAEAERNRYNSDVGRYNDAVRGVVTASRCLGRPLDLPAFQPILGEKVPCPPETDVNVIEVGLPIIRSFTVATDSSSGREIVAAPEDELVLRWNVDNADTIELRRSTTGDPPYGPDFNGSNSVTDPEGSSWNLGPAGHWRFTMFTYLLTARNSCGEKQAFVHVFASQRPQIQIESIEVTQSIQTRDNEVPLVRHKPTVVRVYGTHGLNGFGEEDRVPNVTGRMRVRSGSSWSLWFSPINRVAPNPPDPPLPDPDSSINLPETPDPTRTNDTLNFVIPEALCEGKIDIEVELQVDNFGAPAGSSLGFSERVSKTFEDFVTFRQRRPLKMRFIPTTVMPDPTGATTLTFVASNPPSDEQCRNFLVETFKWLPTMPSSIERLGGFLGVTFSMERTVIETEWGTFDLAPLDDIYGRAPLGYDLEANRFTYWLGILRSCEVLIGGGIVSNFTGAGRFCGVEPDAYWAVLVPVTGAWGRANRLPGISVPGREFITPMRGTTSAHELAHCLNQAHLDRTGCSNGRAPANSFDPTTDPANWPDGGQIPPDVAVPFDVVQNRTITDPTDGVWDLMTYCQTRWTTPQRWQMIFDFIGA
jgi:hypothetical protein